MSQKKVLTSRQLVRRVSVWILGGGLFLVMVGWLMARPQQSVRANDVVAVSGTPSFLPLIRLDPTATPTATPTAVPEPALLTNIAIGNARCPNDIEVNENSGHIYVANSESDNVSILKDLDYLGHIDTGRLPTYIGPDPNSGRTYVTNLTNISGTNQISLFENGIFLQNLPEHFEPVDVVVHPDTGWAYITDLDSHVIIYNGAELVGKVQLPDAGWSLSAAIDEVTGYVYVASWERGLMYVLDGTEVIEQFQVGWGTHQIAIDQKSGFIYVAHESPNEIYRQNISIFHRDDRTLTTFGTARNSQWVAVDKDGYAFFTNPESNTVTVVRGRQLIATLPAGERPLTVTSNQNTGYTFVANQNSDDVSVYKGPALVKTIPAGKQPWAITVNEATNRTYVANRAFEYTCDEVERCYLHCYDTTVTVIE